MGNKQNKNTLTMILLIICCVFIFVLGWLFGSKFAYVEQNISDNNENNDDNTNINQVVESINITNLTFDEPKALGEGGGDINTLSINTSVNLSCSSDEIIGIQLSGYCLDKDDNKYILNGPVGVAAFYCDNNSSHMDSASIYVEQVFDSKGNKIENDNVNWSGVDIRYCKIDKAKFLSKDYKILDIERTLNYEKEF